MLNLAIRSKSAFQRDMNYTTPGVGDRTHHVLMAYLYSKGEPITIHITEDKYGKAHKKESWNQLCDMVPNVRVMCWPVKGLTETEWLNYLKKQGFDCETYHYSDYKFQSDFDNYREGIDGAEIFKTLPELEPKDCSDFFPNLPEKFATIQLDTTDIARQGDFDKIKKKYQKEGYTLFTVGGSAKNKKLRESLQHIGYLISKADIHIGVDSGFFHVAQLYKPWNKIHIHKGDFVSHHLVRAINNGVTII